MADHLNEEEQLESLKHWWNENGRAIVIGVVVAVVGYFGWQGWQAQQQQSQQVASQLFDDILEIAGETGGSIDEDERQQVAALVEELKSDHGNSLYASNAAMLLARLAVQQNAMEEAEQELNWVLEKNTQEAVSLTARLRLAQVQYARGNFDQALTTLDGAEPDTFAATYAELRGDILSEQGETDAAVTAYQSALDNLLEGQRERQEIIEMKLQDVRPTDGDVATNNPGAEN